MTDAQRGRPREFDRDHAMLEAARLFWRYGYSGTSTRALSNALAISTSSLYAAFGSKAELFDQTVRLYAERYREIYRLAVAEPNIRNVIEQLFGRSIEEFTQPSSSHPGCLISSAAMTDSPETLDVQAYIVELHRDLARILLRRIRVAHAEGQLPLKTSPGELTSSIQAIWHGLSVQANLGLDRRRLHGAATLAGHRLLASADTENGHS